MKLKNYYKNLKDCDKALTLCRKSFNLYQSLADKQIEICQQGISLANEKLAREKEFYHCEGNGNQRK